jgi:hypothetical protein
MGEKKRLFYGEVLALKNWIGAEVVSLRFDDKEAVWLAKCLTEASLQVSEYKRGNKVVDVKAVRKPRKDGKYTITVTAQHQKTN